MTASWHQGQRVPQRYGERIASREGIMIRQQEEMGLIACAMQLSSLFQV